MTRKRKKSVENEETVVKRFKRSAFALSKQSNPGKKGQARSHLKTRKEKRKEARKLKKMRRLAFNQRKEIPTTESIEKEKRMKEDTQKEAKLEKKKANRKKLQERMQRAKKREEEEQKRIAMETANKQEDRAIKQLEKQLGLNKRKSKTLPQSFVDDGLSYILDIVDGESKDAVLAAEFESQLEGSDAEDAEGFSSNSEEGDQNQEESIMLHSPSNPDLKPKGILKRERSEKKKKVAFTDEGMAGSSKAITRITDENETEEDEWDESGEENNDGSDESDQQFDDETESDEDDAELVDKDAELVDDEESDQNKDVTVNTENALREDIYGRLRDKEGNVVKAKAAYVPPGKRLELATTVDGKKKKVPTATLR